jgi:pimeloyl-ACP methyl ester carboxylesterase
MAMDELTHIDLVDGRRLDVRITGPADGLTLVFHHGTPSAAVPQRGFERAASARGLRLVTASRPGYGDSTRDPGRRVVDAVADTNAVLDAIGADKCLVGGWSGGGPHALACAARLDRAIATLVIAGVAPYDSPGLDWTAGMGQDNVDDFAIAATGDADAYRAFLDPSRDVFRNLTPEDVAESLGNLVPPVDRAVLTDEFAEDMAASFREAVRMGIDGCLDDGLAFAANWGFDLLEITKPTMIWQGSEDLMVPFAHGQWLAAHIPGSTAHLEQGEGHLSIVIGALDRMFDELVATASRG